MKKQILVLGVDGLVGQTVFSYLHTLFPGSVWGTVRKKKHKAANIFPFSVSRYKKDFECIFEKTGSIAYVINCIGITDEAAKKSLHFVNAVFPHRLERLLEKTQTRLFHISTDAVFSPVSGEVTEQDIPLPVTEYGKSKLAGETQTKLALTIRTSFLGFDRYHKKGVLERVFHTNDSIKGYINQTWSGCTTLQFAQFCEKSIKTNSFDKLRFLSPVFHFAPLHVDSKYLLLQKILATYKKQCVIKKTKGKLITRSLQTSFFDELEINVYTQQIETVLQKMQHSL
jgi:dTDP-4-dehydrorhamnose reductase